MQQENDIAVIATFYRRLQWAALALGILWLIWLLAPILTPFVFGAMLGWLGDPTVDRLERRGLGRNSAVMLVFGTMCLVIMIALILLVPLLEQQITTLVDAVPNYRDWVMQVALPWVERRTGLQVVAMANPDRIITLLREHWEGAGGMATAVLGYVSRSSFTVVTWVANIVLLPVLAFFFLRDWDIIVDRVGALIPRDHFQTVKRLAVESDSVLGGFLRGQLLVMLVLGVLYAVGLWMVGLSLGVLIGLIAGVLTFVPYLGPAAIIVLGGIAALMQYGDWKHLLGVAIVFAVGQVVESLWLTPKLVGDRIGLHPMAVIFAVMAGGVLFGFLGMLLALPVAAVSNVLLSYAHERYRESSLYAGDSPVILLDAGSADAGEDATIG